jgi:hypothetical protein
VVPVVAAIVVCSFVVTVNGIVLGIDEFGDVT